MTDKLAEAVKHLKETAAIIGMLTTSDFFDAAARFGVDEAELRQSLPLEMKLGVTVRRGADLVSGFDCLG